MAGYSTTPLAAKLGIRPGTSLALLGAPEGFHELLGPLPGGVAVGHRLGPGPGPDVVVAFFTARRRLEGRLPGLGRAVHPAGQLWVAWPKRASGVATDVTEDRVREAALPLGLVDNKVCAIDSTWSGLRLVWRLGRRGTDP